MSAQRGVCLPGGCLPANTSPLDRMTNRCKNITLSQRRDGNKTCKEAMYMLLFRLYKYSELCIQEAVLDSVDN